MTADARTRVTEIVSGLGEEGGEKRVAEELLPLVYDELRRLAGRYLRREKPGHTLQATALVHEAYLELVDASRVSWQGRTHFFAVGARVMRRLLIDHARGRGRQRRGGGARRVSLHEALVPAGEDLDREQLLDLDAALEKLAGLDERQARVVELRAFGGLTNAEIAALLGVSERTVERDWRFARAWLRRELLQGDTEGGLP
jgi:RNA polymerase sigma factor (TIGR02999 family)